MPQPTPQPRPARIVIAGVGLISPLGTSAWETFAALLAGRTLTDRAAALPPDIGPVALVRAVGAVASAQHGSDDPAVELAERATREACFMAGVEPAGLTAFLGTSKGAVGAMADDPRWAGRMAGGLSRRQVEAVTLGPHGYLSHHLQQRLGLRSTTHHVAACASSLTAMHHARLRLLDLPAIRHPPSAILVITCEAALNPLFIHSYRRLGVLAPLTPDGYQQRPLDAARRGFMLSEMSAAIVLKRLPPDAAPQPGHIELLDTAIACEAHDLIRPAPTMPALTHVARRVLRPNVEVIHPHAPGTPDHDPLELDAYLAALADHPPSDIRLPPSPAPLPDLYACKGALGHPLGAAGLTALVLACLCLTAGRRPPMPWLENPLPQARPRGPSRPDGIRDGQPCSRTGAHAVFSAGFGGHVAAAVIRRHG